jgi:PAS domain S-box-containing protein
MNAQNLTTLTRVVILSAFYFAGGLLGKEAAFAEGAIALVWPPSGIALAAICLFGYRFWPGVAIGALLFSFMQDRPWIFMLGTAIGNTAGALVCHYLLERFVQFKPSMERVRDVAGFVGLACLLGTTVNALFNSVSLFYTGDVTWDQLFQVTLEWWVPNAMGALVVTPIIMSFGSPSFIQWNTQLFVEAAVCSVGLIGGTAISFNSWYAYGIQNYPFAYLPYPFLVWGALRFGQRGATAGTLIVTAFSISSLLQGRGPFVTGGVERDSLMLIGTYISILAVTNLMLAAAATERKVAEEAARKSEAMFLLISENVGDMIAVTDATGRRLYNSPYYARIFGNQANLSGTDAFEQIHPEDRDMVKRTFHETISTGVGKRIEYRFLLPDKSIRYIESLGNYVKGDHGELAKLVSISRDITDRKRDEEQLRLLASAVRFADDTIFITNAELDLPGPTIVFVNPAFTRMTGFGADEVIGQTPRILYGNKTDRQVLERVRDSLVQGHVARGEAVCYRKDGSEFYSEWHVEPIKNETGETTHYLTIQRDISERKKIEAELARARDDALAAAKMKAEFLANMSHEIRTPMNGVIGMTNLLLKTQLTQQQVDYARTIRTSADSLLTIINDILDFSKIEAGKLTFEMLDFDLCEAVEVTLELIAAQAHGKGIELAGHVQDGIPTQLRGDLGRLRQVLTNLLSNAVKFTQRGEVVLRVTREAETPSHVMVKFEVRDSGIGISKDAQAKLFQAFTQADGSTTRKYGGTGLGLAISKQLVNLMQGQIGVESEVGRGSTFWFTARFEKQTAPSKVPARQIQSLANLRVLIVDDNATNRQILRAQVQAWHMRGRSADTGAEALMVLRQAASVGETFDLAILDMQMPLMDGMQLARTIHAEPQLAGLKMILLTSLGDQFDAPTLRAVGIGACLVKPVRQSRLFDCLTSVVAGAVTPSTSAQPQQVFLPPAPAQPMHANLRVLLAEDNTINQKVAIGQLQELGYTADVAGNGVEVLEALKRGRYDIILMDCQMPEMDGYEATRNIRRWEQEKAFPSVAYPVHIIAMTANAMQGDKEKCLAAGMNDYVSKPVEVEELQAAFERWRPPIPQAPVASVPPPQPAPMPPSDEPPVNLKRLQKLTYGNAAKFREMIDLYISQADELMGKLDLAVKADAAKDIEQLAHKLCGASSTCGMTAIVASLRELERQGREGVLTNHAQVHAEAVQQLARIKEFLNAQLASGGAA